MRGPTTAPIESARTLTSEPARCRCLEHSEAALLVGDTGVGKTTLCQMLAFMRRQRLHIVNCSRNTEAADLLGSFRPNRGRQAAVDVFAAALQQAAGCAASSLCLLQQKDVITTHQYT